MADVSHILPESFLNFVSAGGEKGDKVDNRVQEIYASLHKYASADARRKWLEQRAKCKKAALENEFFDEKEKVELREHGQEPHVVNRLVKGIQGSSAIPTSNRPDIKVFPLRDSDPYLAELCKNALEHVWLKNFGNDTVYDAVEERNIGGIGVMYATVDKNRGPFGSVVFYEDDPELWYWDARSKKRDRADTHLIKAQLRSVGYIKATYGDYIKERDIISVDDDFIDKPVKLPDTSTSEDNYKRDEQHTVPPSSDKPRRVWEIEAYLTRREREHWALVVISNTPEVIRLSDVGSKKEALEAIEYIRANGLPAPDGSESVPVDDISYWPRVMDNRYKIIVVGTKIVPQPSVEDEDKEVDEVLNPYGMDSDGDPVLPVIFYYGQRTSSAYYYGPTFYAFDPNKSLCKREAQYTLAISKNLSAPIARDMSSRWRDPKRPDLPGNELLLGKGDRDPQRLQPGVVDFAALTNRIIEDKQNIDDAYNLPEVMQGKVPKGLERMSGRLGLALQDTGTIMHNPSISALESALGRLGKTLLSLVIRSWPRAKWESLATEERIRDFIPVGDKMSEVPEQDKTDELKAQEKEERRGRWIGAINKVLEEGISIVDFNVMVTAGSSLPTNRLLKQETALEYYKMGLFDRVAALEYSDYPNAKEVAERIDQREMQMAQMGMKSKKG